MTESAANGSSQKRPPSTKPNDIQPNNTQPSYYDLLEIRPNASVQDIRRAYRDLSKLYHPDTTELESAIAIPKFQALNEAYATLSSPEKRLTYDYKTGFSRISVIQPLMEDMSSDKASVSEKYGGNAYISPSDRQLSAGEFFALFILGITFIACLLLVVTLSLTKGDLVTTNLDLFPPSSETTAIEITDELTDELTAPASVNEPIEPLPDLPEQPWLVPEPLAPPMSAPATPPE